MRAIPANVITLITLLRVVQSFLKKIKYLKLESSIYYNPNNPNKVTDLHSHAPHVQIGLNAMRR